MQSLTPLRLRPVIQRIYCINEAHRSTRTNASKTNLSLVDTPIPEKPKRPGNAFLQFIGDVQSKIYSDNPEASRREIIKSAGSLWRQAEPDIKQRYRDIFLEKNKEYERQLEAFAKNLTTEQKEAIAEFEGQITQRKKFNNFRNKLKELGKPKRPPSAYGLFLSEHRQRKKLENETNDVRFRRLVQDWKNLPSEEKEEYLERARELLNNFNQDVKEWETTMLKRLDLNDEDIEALTEYDTDGKRRTKSRKLSNYIYSLIMKNSKKEV